MNITIPFIIAGVVVVNNWKPGVEDKTPPEKITDLVVLNAAADGDDVFTISWTAPGDDLNVGQGKDMQRFKNVSRSNIYFLFT